VELLRTVEHCISATVVNLNRLDVDLADIVAVGLANQRETTVVWDKVTGEPLYNAIVWMDARTQSTAQAILDRLPRDENSVNHLQHLCGLPISSYFSALKLRERLNMTPAMNRHIPRFFLAYTAILRHFEQLEVSTQKAHNYSFTSNSLMT
jgi:glycerol kinase